MDESRPSAPRSVHGVELWATRSTSSRLLDLAADDVVFVAAVVDGRLLPICRLLVGEVTTYEELVAERDDPYPLLFQAIRPGGACQVG